jgi:hypothetical protein
LVLSPEYREGRFDVTWDASGGAFLCAVNWIVRFGQKNRALRTIFDRRARFLTSARNFCPLRAIGFTGTQSHSAKHRPSFPRSPLRANRVPERISFNHNYNAGSIYSRTN